MSIADKLTTIAENEQKVYAAGQQSEYDRFWDAFQQNGKRTIYRGAFSGAGWTQETLKPKYPIKPSTKVYTSGADGMFEYCGWQNTEQIDFSDIIIDFSNCTRSDNLFANANVKNVNVDLSTFTRLNYVFARHDGGLMDNITVKVSELCTKYDYTFYSNTGLKNLTFAEGSVIAATLDLSYSNLTVASMKSVINALKNFTGTDKEFAYTIRFKSACWTALEADSTAPDGGTWKDYVFNTLCWNY